MEQALIAVLALLIGIAIGALLPRRNPLQIVEENRFSIIPDAIGTSWGVGDNEKLLAHGTDLRDTIDAACSTQTSANA